MANTAEGIEVAAPPEFENLDSDAGFAAALATITGNELSEERKQALDASDTSVERGLTTESSPTHNRDDRGRFTPAAPEPETESTEGVATEETTAEVPSTSEADQVMIGRQASEIGDLRTKNAELAERLARLEGRAEAQQEQPQQQLPTLTRDEIASAVAEHDGPQVITDLVNYGFPDGHPAYDQAYTAWIGMDDTGEAVAAYTRYRTALNKPEYVKPVQGEDPFLAEMKTREAISSSLDAVSGKFKPEEWKLIEPHLTPVLEDPELPEYLLNAVVSDDPKTQQDALMDVARRARERAVSTETKKADVQRQQASVEAKKTAQVASGSLRVAEERKPTPEEMTPEERQEAFRKRILATETTDVASGLTFGPQQ